MSDSQRVLERRWKVSFATGIAAKHLKGDSSIEVVIDNDYNVTTPAAPQLTWHTDHTDSDFKMISGTVTINESVTWQFVITDGKRLTGRAPILGIIHLPPLPPPDSYGDGDGAGDEPGVWESEGLGNPGGGKA